MKTVIEMAREAGGRAQQNKNCDVEYLLSAESIERLVELARADERDRATEEANRRANASWTLMCEKTVAAEREACAKVCEAWQEWGTDGALLAKAIRARSNT